MAKKVPNESSADHVPCDIDQGDEVGELARSKDNFATNSFPDSVNLMRKFRNMVKHAEENLTNIKL